MSCFWEQVLAARRKGLYTEGLPCPGIKPNAYRSKTVKVRKTINLLPDLVLVSRIIMVFRKQFDLMASAVAPGLGQPNIFNFVRLLLAVAVIFSHSWPILFGSHSLDPLAGLLHDQIDLTGDHPMDTGHIAVYCFFVISGYLISMSFQRSRGVTDYLKKRVLRIYPGFLVAILMCLVLFGPLGADQTSVYWHDLAHSGRTVLHALMLKVEVADLPFPDTLSQVPVAHAVNGSTWTIQYEFLAYLMVAVLGTAASVVLRRLPPFAKRSCPILLFLAIYLVYAGSLHAHSSSAIVSLNRADAFISKTQIPRLFVYFVAGMCFYAYRHWVRYNLLFTCLALGVLGVSALTPPLLPLTFPIFGSYVLLAISMTNIKWLTTFGTRHDLSYGVYLYAFPIQQLLVGYYGQYLTPILLFLAALPLAFLFAWLSWVAVEKPALKLKGRHKGKHIIAAAVSLEASKSVGTGPV